jgi:subtilisin family serine protease
MSRRTLSLFFAIAAITGLALFSQLNNLGVAAQGSDEQDPATPEKRELKYPELSWSLNQLVGAVESEGRSPERAAEDAPVHSGDSVGVIIWLSANVDDVADFLADSGVAPRGVTENFIEAFVPVSLLGQLSQQPGVIRVEEVVPPPPAYGNFTSQGVSAHRATAWHGAEYRGQGVKVGIIDNGFMGYSELIGQELPVPAGVRCFPEREREAGFTNNLADCELRSKHGTGVAENVIDIAPEVSLYLANSPGFRTDSWAIVDWMISEGVTVINRSLGGPFWGPGDGTSPIPYNYLELVDRAVEGGIAFVSSAGNEHEQSWFEDTPSFAGGILEFADGDTTNSMGYRYDGVPYLRLPEGREVWAYLRWEDTWPGASTDLDIFVLEASSGDIIDASVRPQSGDDNHYPTERLYFEIPREGEYYIVVEHVSGELPSWIQLMAPQSGELEHFSDGYSIGSLDESANPGMMAVGATHYWDTNTIADYSSLGPTPDGRIKPDIVGTACGETATYEVGLRNGNNCWFAGTSSASPHVAGLAALVKQTHPFSTSQQVVEYLKNNAAERGPSGPDNTWGYGFAELPAAPDQIVDPCGEELISDGAISGSWTQGCQSQHQVTSQHPYIGYARYYRFTLAQESVVTIDLESDVVDTYLYLRSADARAGGFLYENDDVVPGADSNSQIVATLPAGSYTIEATTYGAATLGSFTLGVSGINGDSGGVQPPTTDSCTEALTADGERTGEWVATCQSQARSGFYAQYYTFTLTESREVTITLRSSEDTHLFLRQGNTEVAQNDDHGTPLNTAACANATGLGQRDSCITVSSLNAGSYTIEATTYGAATLGSFTLGVSGLEASPVAACAVGDNLIPGQSCSHFEFTATVESNGDLSLRFTGTTVPPSGLSLSRSGNNWIINGLP